jgi:tetratricopeptide (TPR) repeat protein
MWLVFWGAVRFLWLIVGMMLTYSALTAALNSWQTTSSPDPTTALLNAVLPIALYAFVCVAPWVLVDQWLAQQERNAKAQQTYLRLSRDPNARLREPLIFYLRSFDWDEKFANEKMKRSVMGPLWRWLVFNPIILLVFVWVRLYERFGGRLESLTYRAAVQSWGPMIGVSLGRPSGARGFGRVWTVDAEWQETASSLLNRADLVLMMFSDTTGTSWELEQLATRGRLAHTVFVVPPAYALRENDDLGRYHLERDYRVFSERMAALGYATPAYRQAMAFRVDPDPARATWVDFAQDFDKGRSAQLGAWLRARRAELGTEIEANTNSTKWRNYAIGGIRLAAAAILGFSVEADQERKVRELERREAFLESRCSLASIADHDAIIAACSTIIQNAGGVTLVDPETINIRGLVHLRHGETSEAIADFTSIIERESENSVGYYNRALARRQGGDVLGALEDLSRVVAIETDRTTLADVHRLTGEILLERNDATGAVREFDAAIAQRGVMILSEPRWRAEIYVLRAHAHWQLENYPAAIDDGERALELDPQHSPAFMVQAYARNSSGDYAGAIADVDRVLALEPNNADALRLRGLARIRLGQDEAGLADLDAADAIAPLPGSEDPR